MAIQFTNGTATHVQDDSSTKGRKFNLPSAYYDDEPKPRCRKHNNVNKSNS